MINYNPERDYPPSQDEIDDEIREELARDAWDEHLEQEAIREQQEEEEDSE